jgi:hypothetical protein
MMAVLKVEMMVALMADPTVASTVVLMVGMMAALTVEMKAESKVWMKVV